MGEIELTIYIPNWGSSESNNTLIAACFVVALCAYIVVKVKQLYQALFGTPAASNGYDDHDNNNSTELKEVVVVVDEETVKEVSKNCTECAICLEKLGVENEKYEKYGREKGELVLKQCGHRFHEPCMLTWFSHGNRTCPTCRRPCYAI